jgi:hypothetical protein
MERKVSLTTEQAQLCQNVLSRDLARVTLLLAKKKDESGLELTDRTERELLGLRSRLHATLSAFGVSRAVLEAIHVKFGAA